MSEKQWVKLARNILRAGEVPMPINQPLLDLIKELINEDQLNFLLNFKKPSYTLEEIKEWTVLDDNALKKMLNDLMHIGVVTGIPSRSTGIMVYRLVAFLPGLLEFTLMRGETGEKQKRLAKIWERFFNELKKGTQNNYDTIIEVFKTAPPFDRVVPVDEEIEVQEEKIFPFEDVKKIIENAEVIGLQYCYCRHLKDLLEDPCKLDAPRHNCFSFGRTAKFCIEQGFSEEISKEEAIKILKEAEDAGLVHKAIHSHSNPELEEIGLCNCCKCCCGSLSAFHNGTSPISSVTSYIAKIIKEKCVGCGTCVEKCPIEAIDLNNEVAKLNAAKCIGCGLCAYHCPEKAINLNRTGLRTVFIPPPRIKIN
ncbi:MAG: 4Fe-4S dicluster domain-containing protein [Promethearchaeota archaeon]|nr:MAG: 4Fe-4S dicluster domain-containing protein [Candidatus Lokiarchaeota archaeon]